MVTEALIKGTPHPNQPPPGQSKHTRGDEGMRHGVNNEETGKHDLNKLRKPELPLFSREDPLGWIFLVERYFAGNGINEQERLDGAVVGHTLSSKFVEGA